MASVFLVGGGWQEKEETFGRFARAASVGAECKIALILHEGADTDREEISFPYRSTFANLGVTQHQLKVIWVSQDKPFAVEKLNEHSPTGIFVGGGTTPLYQEALCRDSSFADYICDRKLPYGGFSAGAAIAAEKAVVGGWKLHSQHKQEVAIVDEECSEGLEWLTVAEGLGLVPFSVDVHATQWGNLARMIHAVENQQVRTGWAIDEDTLMQIEDKSIQVWGLGQVYRVQRLREGQVHLDILRAGEQYRLG